MFWILIFQLVVILALIIAAYSERRDLRGKINAMGEEISWYRGRYDDNRHELLSEQRKKAEAVEEALKWKLLVSRVQADIEQTIGVEES